MSYEISKDGEVIAQSKVLKAVETQASFIDFIVIPEISDSGLHIINIKIFEEEVLISEVSASFQITGSGSDQIKIYFFVLLGVVILVGILIMVVIFVRKKK
ncbi:MAG: hypothetical protein IH845_05385 [Nanoarchaeota archaeon]|nr:hypothetical protein [Nanoarchaeota archaeon]